MTTKENEGVAGAMLKGYGRLPDALAFVPVSKRTFLRWQAQGRIPHAKVGRVTLYRMADLERFLERHTVRAIG